MSAQSKHETCFERDVLVAFVLGKLPDEEFEQVAAEIETCPKCQAVLETLDDLEDSVIRDLREGGSGARQIDPALAAQIRKAEGISRVVWGSQPDASSESADAPPRTLGQYELLEQIGRGGMGTVWRAMHLRLKRPVAVKLLPQSRLRDSQAVARFQREMEAVGRLDHQHLVRAHDAGEVEGQHFLVMELLDGPDLAKAVRTRGPLPIPEACEAVRQAATGLQYAHEHGLIHRDVKPSNLMLTTAGQVKVLDLGLARLVDPTGDVWATGTGQVLGTGDFMAPEQAEDTRNADARSDVYALGCTLYFLLAGRAPFADPRYDTFVRKLLAHAQEPVPPIRSLRPGIPEPLADILERMLRKNPADRLQTAAEVEQALEPFAGSADLRRLATGEALPHTRTCDPRPTANRQDVTGPTTPAPDSEMGRTRSGRPNRGWPAVLLAVLAVGLSFVAAWWALAHRQASSPLARAGPVGQPQQQTDRPRLAVLYFENHSGDAGSLAALEKGLCAMMIADLATTGEYQVVERERLQAVLEELELSYGPAFDRDTAARVGKLLGAQQLVLGSYFELMQTFRLDARIVDVETGVTLAATGVEGAPDDFGRLLRELSASLVNKHLGIPYERTSAESPETDIGAASTPSLTLVTRFGKALDAYDRGDADTSRQIAREILADDSGFEPARRWLDVMEDSRQGRRPLR